MEICTNCGKGYCPSRVRKTYGKAVRAGFCSVKCTSAAEDDRDLAVDIVEAAYVEGFISDEVMEQETRYLGLVELIRKRLSVRA